MHPPTIDIDNNAHDKWTVVTIDSANRPGSLIYVRPGAACCCWLPLAAVAAVMSLARPGSDIACLRLHPPSTPYRPPSPATPSPGIRLPAQIVQHFTELDLRITSARISSDGGWFVDGARSWGSSDAWQRGACSARAGAYTPPP